MVDKNKVLFLNSSFTKSSLPAADESDESVTIEGYASTTDVDRHGDIVPASVWEKGVENYLKNPVILAYHNHSEPIGRMIEHRVDAKGLWIKARISKAAGDVFGLVKDGVLTAFSIGFRIADAEYNSALELFVVKELELHEISVVSVPANQNTLFSLSKAFDTAEEFKSFKMQFANPSDSAKGLEASGEAKSDITKELEMTPEQLQKMLADAATAAADQATKSLLAAQEKAAAEKAAAAATQADLDAKIKAAVALATPSTTGAEALLAEVEKRFAAQADETKSVVAGLEASLKEKAAELEAIQKSRMQFTDSKAGEMSYADKEKAVILAKMAGKGLADTKFGREMVQKYGGSGQSPHLPSATWELEVSLNMENEVRRRLVVAPNLRSISMATNVMTIPVNPEAGVATWMANTAFGTTASAGNTATHALKEITLNAYKVATNEYVAYEEEEDALLAIMPVIRDAMVRRVARAVDRAMLRGAGSGSDPVKGLAEYDAISAVTLDISANDKTTVAKLQAMRRDLGAWGLDPSELVYIVSTEGYYDLLEDTNFLTVDKVGTIATLLTGQIGAIGNTPVLVSAEFADKADGAVNAICFAPGNFLAGNQRGLRVDTQDLVETQRRVMVASLRTGMTQVTTNLGPAVSALRFVP
jgi:HK97 family phage prohead protease/HK97 family phage major capsid protein